MNVPCPKCGKARELKKVPKRITVCFSCAAKSRTGNIVWEEVVEKACIGCKTVKPAAEFHRYRRTGRLHSLCNICKRNNFKKWQKNIGRFARYGLTKQDFTNMLEAQGGKCAICDSTEPLCIDHCHTTGRVRKLLCGTCNKTLGLMQEDPGRLERMLNYVRSECQK